MPPDRPDPVDRGQTRVLGLIVHSGAYEKVAYAWVMATAAAAINRPVLVFVTEDAVDVLRPDGWRQLAGDPVATEALERARGVASLPELIAMAETLGIRVIACEMALRRRGIDAAELDPARAIEVAGLVTLYTVTATGQIVFI